MPHLLKDGNGRRKLCEKIYAINYAKEAILNYRDMRYYAAIKENRSQINSIAANYFS